MSACCEGTITLSCSDCARRLCAWHYVLSPVQLGGRVLLVPVCWPPCADPYWSEPVELRTEEGSARAAKAADERAWL